MTAPPDAILDDQFPVVPAGPAEAGRELTLFVSGASDLSAGAIADATRLCEISLRGRYHLSVVNLHEDPVQFLSSDVLAAPTLVRNLPLPVRRVTGDLSNTARVLSALDLAIADSPDAPWYAPDGL